MAPVEPPLLSTEMLDRLGDAVTMVDRDWTYTYVSPGAATIIGKPADEVVGRRAWDVFPEAVGTPQHDTLIRAMTQRTTERVVWYFDTVNRWHEGQAFPAGDGLMIVVNDVTHRETVVRRSRQLLDIGESLAACLTVEDVKRMVAHHARVLVDATAGAIMLMDDDRDQAAGMWWGSQIAQERWRDFPLDPATPSVDAYRSGEPVTVSGLAAIGSRYPHLLETVQRMEQQSISAFPLSVGSVRLGALVLMFESEPAFEVLDTELIATIAAMTAQAIARAQLYESAQANVGALQRSLLPPKLPLIEGLDLAARYAACEATLDIGGDWFDVIQLRAGAVGIVMGDVEGHDLAAAALMGLVRSAVRAYAIEEHPPAVIMQRANEFLASLARDRLVTVSYSQVHPQEGLITTVSAGHLPSMITSDDEEVRDVPTEIGPPLGVTSGGMLWPESTSTMRPRSVIALFTDGLVETRTDDISIGIDRVRAALAALKSLSVEDVADGVLATRLPAVDDVALIIGKVTATVDANRVITRRLPPTPASVSLARRFVRQLLAEWHVADGTAADVELALSEIVTNAARHSEDTLDLRLSCTPEVVRFSVSDSSHRMPGVIETADNDSTAGRGLHLVDAVATRWGIESDGLGKTVWCEFAR
ncbi:MAG: SpoIIE family protein phosphatase [Mycobacteriales bacterium]